MQKLFLQKRDFKLRAVLLFGVFAGLLFSCGEGIRLFPFPIDETAATAEGGGWKSKSSGFYQKNIYRFETKQEKQFKFQPELPPHLVGGFNLLNNFLPLFTALSYKGGFSFFPQSNSTNEIAELIAKRGPPFSKFL